MSTSTADMHQVREALPIFAAEPPGLYEVIDGQIKEKLLGAREAFTASMFPLRLGAFVLANNLGHVVTELLFDLRPAVDRSRRPDAAFVSAATLPMDDVPPDGVAAWAVVPELAIEVVSLTNTAVEVAEKVEDYFRAGCRRVWVVYPVQGKLYDYTATNAVRILGRADTLDAEGLFPGLALPMRLLLGKGQEG